jgi:hypothetical protein
MTPEQLRTARFRLAQGAGYRPSDVHELLARVSIQLEAGQSPRTTIERSVLGTVDRGYVADDVDRLLAALYEAPFAGVPTGIDVWTADGTPVSGWVDPPRSGSRRRAVGATVAVVIVAVMGAVRIGAGSHSSGAANAVVATTAPATAPVGSAPRGLCAAVAKVQKDLFVTSDNGSPPTLNKTSLFGDGFKLGLLGSLAGDPYNSQVQAFGQYAREGDVVDSVKALDEIDRECALPPVTLPGQIA